MEKRSFKMPSAFTTLLLLTAIVAVLTFIVPAGQYQYEGSIPIAGTYEQVASNPQGIWDVISAPISGFKGAIDVALFILVLGGCLGVIFETKAIDAGLAQVITKLKGRERIMIPILMILCSIGGTTYGMAEETIAFYPLVVPILLAAGYDVVTAVMVIFLGAGVGVGGGIINPFSVGIASNLAGISIGDGIFVRFILYLCYLAFAIWFVMRYAEKVKRNPEKSIVYDIKELTEASFRKSEVDSMEFTKMHKRVLMIFAGMFVVMIIGIIPWSYKFGIDIFQNLHDGVQSIPVIGAVIGNALPLGDWYFQEMTMIFLVGAILIGKVYGMKEKEIVGLFIYGAKDILSVALILGVAKGISVVMTNGLIIDTVLFYGETLLGYINATFFPAIAYLFYIPLSFLIPSSSGLATATIPILAPLSEFANVGKEYVVMACQAGSESMNFISPTQAVLIGALAITNIPYERWLKHIMPFFLGIVGITVVVITLGSMFI